MKLTPELLKSVFQRSNIDTAFLESFILTINTYRDKAMITNDIHMIRFLAQCRHEIMFHRDGTPYTEENLNFREDIIKRLSRYWRQIPDTLHALYSRGDMRSIMNGWYGGRMGNRLNTDDGYNYIGHGCLMITGRNNHIKILRRIESWTGETLLSFDGELLDREIFKRYDIFTLMGMAFWYEFGLYKCKNTNCVTNKVNRGLPAKEKRERLETAIRVKKLLNP